MESITKQYEFDITDVPLDVYMKMIKWVREKGGTYTPHNYGRAPDDFYMNGRKVVLSNEALALEFTFNFGKDLK